MKPMKPIVLKPFVSAGELFVDTKGNPSLVPLSLFQTESGSIILRVGENTYWFDEDGVYDGPEARFPSPPDAKHVAALLEESTRNRGRAPAEAYFEPGCPGHDAETALWPKHRPS